MIRVRTENETEERIRRVLLIMLVHTQCHHG
jgi:hypothetical protein